MDKIKPREANQGECALCNHVGTVAYHHIIPKRQKIKTNKKVKLIWGAQREELYYTYHKQRVEQLMIQVCQKCHKKLHPENWKFHMNEAILDEELTKK